MAKTEKKLIANNKKAYHDYFILEKYEAGIVLHGTEVKSLRMGKCSIKESFIRIEQPRGEAIYYTKGNGTKFLDRFRLRTPTTSNIPPMLDLLKGCQLGDVALLILTIDPCISCTER